MLINGHMHLPGRYPQSPSLALFALTRHIQGECQARPTRSTLRLTARGNPTIHVSRFTRVKRRYERRRGVVLVASLKIVFPAFARRFKH